MKARPRERTALTRVPSPGNETHSSKRVVGTLRKTEAYQRDDELDPRVQRFLRFMVETAVRALLREHNSGDAGDPRTPLGEAPPERPGNTIPLQSNAKEK